MPEDITYLSKDDIHCPVCDAAFKREEMLTGRGRLSAGELTNELRRNYLPTQKYGSVNPLIYPLTVCPDCLYAADDYDFLSVPQKAIPNLRNYRSVRADYLLKMFGKIPNFREKRNMITGVSSYILAMSSYPFFDKKKFSPTIKIGIYALRVAWLFADLFKETKESKYNELSQMFYRKAAQFYDLALDNQSKAIEPLDAAKSLGPDTDKNFGYDGLLYVNAILKYNTAHYIEDPYEKLQTYEQVKRLLSKVFGIGRKAKDKPEVLLSFAKEIYEKLTEEMEALQTSLGQLDKAAVPGAETGDVAAGE